ncbi:hypothetical protein [Sulfurimonas sp.]|uniref:hypothetical protein n=1 Tax=Sulfurimonas sp. TaxID=2022749 RepID=UPI0025F02371|nr:hypothetical protein [Sulfurimonas sp.]MDD5157599.1 hypothetical protein [Sulfurimonas sp.]
MSLAILLSVAALLSIGFHFLGVYTGSKKTVWIMLVFLWSVAIGTAMNEIKPAGYDDIKKMKGKFSDTDKLIEEAMPKVSLYEMIVIKKSYQTNNPQK